MDEFSVGGTLIIARIIATYYETILIIPRPLDLGFRTCRLNANTVRWGEVVVDKRCRKSGRRDWGGAPRGGTDLIIHCMYYNSHMINNSLENSLCYQMPTLLPTANSQGSRTNCQLIWSSAVCCLAGHSTVILSI